jgi:GNAT superfamily N-acetyltransferase
MIRQATINDFADIKQIKEVLALEVTNLNNLEYKLRVQQKGFLLKSSYTEENMTQDLQKIYLAYEEGGKVIGFVRIDEEQEMSRNADAFWFRPEMKESFFIMPHADLGGISVLPEHEHQGIATKMLGVAEREVKAKGIAYLFSFVVLSPVINFPSIMFHEKNGFDRLACVNAPELFEMKNFQSFLYGKKL